jgi:hypothetical protein
MQSYNQRLERNLGTGHQDEAQKNEGRSEPLPLVRMVRAAEEEGVGDGSANTITKSRTVVVTNDDAPGSLEFR